MNHPHPQSSESFGELLRLLRQRAHLTQRELAVIVGYSDAQINRYEKGARTPDPSVVAALFLKALGLEPESDLAARLVALAHKPVQIVINGMTIDANIDQQLRAKLPSPTTDLLGRDSDIKSVLEMLSCDNVRMLTLVGPPGVGKTRLAIQLAVELESQYQHGAIFVALAAIARQPHPRRVAASAGRHVQCPKPVGAGQKRAAQAKHASGA